MAITYEMVHETRLIPVDDVSRRPHLSKNIDLDMGDARGHWENDTLVVETTNFKERSAFRGASSHLKIIERFKPLGPKTIEWVGDTRRSAHVGASARNGRRTRPPRRQ